ncbi:hypothetical protein Tco_0911413 [Tanacetum coccineum]|uniref:Uncharacterized protein n=1 Tax=Tanacetum coccineum TaxID=301880 RepID=A0ABQ5CYV9_9ASTR
MGVRWGGVMECCRFGAANGEEWLTLSSADDFIMVPCRRLVTNGGGGKLIGLARWSSGHVKLRWGRYGGGVVVGGGGFEGNADLGGGVGGPRGAVRADLAAAVYSALSEILNEHAVGGRDTRPEPVQLVTSKSRDANCLCASASALSTSPTIADAHTVSLWTCPHIDALVVLNLPLRSLIEFKESNHAINVYSRDEYSKLLSKRTYYAMHFLVQRRGVSSRIISFLGLVYTLESPFYHCSPTLDAVKIRSKVITPFESSEEPEDPLIIGEKELRTIPKKDKSSVEDLVPIPSRSKGISDDTCDNSDAESLLSQGIPITSPKIDFLSKEFTGEFAPILPGMDEDEFDEEEVDGYDHDISSDNDSYENIEYVEASSLNLEYDNVILHEKLLNIIRLITNIESLKNNPTPDFVFKSPSSFPILVVDSDSFFEESDTTLLSHSGNSLPEFETFSDHTEETRSGSTTTHANYSLPEYDSFLFEMMSSALGRLE